MAFKIIGWCVTAAFFGVAIGDFRLRHEDCDEGAEHGMSLLQVARPALVPNGKSRKKHGHRHGRKKKHSALTAVDGSWCGTPQEGKNFANVTVYADYFSGELFLDLTDALTSQKPLRLTATAMAAGGTVTDDDGQLARLGTPLEETGATMFEFALSKDGAGVDLYRPQLGLRSSDPQLAEALARGTGSGWLGGFRTWACNDGIKTPQDDIPKKQRSHRIIIDGASLIERGFIVAPNAAKEAGSYRLLKVQSFPRNLDVTVEFVSTEPRIATQVGFSLVLLPEVPMVPRAGDDRLLYFTTDYVDKGQHLPKPDSFANEASDRPVSMIWRYNLDVLPNKQIKVYVDPTVPERWRKNVQEGVESWNPAFEAIGFQNAIRAILPGDEDWPADYDMNDVRFSTISWSISDEVSSMGISKVDPRSGEILKSDISMSDGWVKAWLSDLDHFTVNVSSGPDMKRAYTRFGRHRRRHKVQSSGDAGTAAPMNNPIPVLAEVLSLASLTQPANARKILIGDGIRAVVMHEVGHILGLRHNFKGSLGVSYECTQDITCSAVHGLSASVMDYLPLNLPAKMGRKVHSFSPVIGAYDKLAIGYGYKKLSGNDTSIDGDISPELEFILKVAEEFPTCYDENEFGDDPACIAYDLTTDPVAYGEKQLDMLSQVQKKLLETTVAPGKPYVKYGEAVDELLAKAETIAQDLLMWIGGVTSVNAHRRSNGWPGRAAQQPVPAEVQKRALAAFLSVLRPDKLGLLPQRESYQYLVWQDVWPEQGYVTTYDLGSSVRDLVSRLISTALDDFTLMRLHRTEELPSVGKTGLTVGEYLEQVVASIIGDGLDVKSRSEWHVHRELARGLKGLHKQKSLPESLTSRVLFHIQYLKTAVDAALDRQAPGPGWTWCATEGDVCSCSGIVRFGIRNSWAPALAVTGTIICNTTKFGDPLQSVRKECECLAGVPAGDDLLQTHLYELHMELADVFCEGNRPCSARKNDDTSVF